MDLLIKDKLALVVGASKGMGRAVAEELSREGCRVIAIARTKSLLDTLEMVNDNWRIECDVSAFDSPTKIAEYIKKEIGNPDIIYHCVGGSIDGIRDVKAHSSDWLKVWWFNVGIAIDLNNEFIPAMVEKKWGRIVHTLSDAVKNNIGNVPYTSSKFAVEGYVKTASKLYSKDNVIISAVAPGPIYTEGRFIYSQSPEWTQEYFDKYLPIQRFGRAEEVAKVVAFLCSEHASYMPGAVVNVDGGCR